jgi:hypothetical protein
MNSIQKNNKVIITSGFMMEEKEQIKYIVYYENDVARKRPFGEFSYTMEKGENKEFSLLKYDSLIYDQLAESSDIQFDRNTLRPFSFTFNYSCMNLDLDMVGKYEKDQLLVECVSEGVKHEHSLEVPFKILDHRQFSMALRSLDFEAVKEDYCYSILSPLTLSVHNTVCNRFDPERVVTQAGDFECHRINAKIYHSSPCEHDLWTNVNLMYMVEPPHHLVKITRDNLVIEMQDAV